MKQVVIGSTNTVKIDATQRAFAAMFPEETFEFINIDTPSGVSAQPWGKEETLRGAWNRVADARQTHPGANFYVAVESGAVRGQCDDKVWIINMIAISDGENENTGQSPPFVLPPAVAVHVLAGDELATAFDKVLVEKGTRNKQGGVGFLTGDAVTRTDLYDTPIRLALIPWKNPDLYPWSFD